MPNWKRIKLNKFEFPKVVNYYKDYIKFDKQLPKGVKLKRIDKVKNNLIIDALNEDIVGIGQLFTSQVMKSFNAGIGLYTPNDVKVSEPIRIQFNIDKENPTVLDHNVIYAEENSQVSILFDYYTDDSVEGFHNGITKVYAKENSIVNIIKIQRMNDKSHNFDSNIAYVEGRGQVNWISIELGSHVSGSSFATFLKNELSEGNLSSVYLGDGHRRMDLEYSMIHQGRRSISNIETQGVLMDHARKVFRGNLDFKRGARHSNGSETEYAVLLDPTVVAHSIPALLCDEDDVQGEHAASAGQIDDNQLFYLMSRGLTEREAKKLIVEASFKPTLDKLNDFNLEDLRDDINKEIDRRLMNV